MNNDDPLKSPLTFSITPAGIRAQGRMVLFTMLSVIALGVAVAVVANLTQNKGYDWLVPVGAVTLGGIYVSSLMYKQNLRAASSFTITWNSLTITRQVDPNPKLELYHRDIQSIEETKKGMLILTGTRPVDIMVIPNYIERREELRALLETLQPIKARRLSPGFWLNLILINNARR